jgi:hypothetical protein
MANMRRGGKAVARKRRAAAPAGKSREALRCSVFDLTNKLEEPLHHALQMVRVIAQIAPAHDEDKEAIGLVAQEAAIKLATVGERVGRLFALCRNRG